LTLLGATTPASPAALAALTLLPLTGGSSAPTSAAAATATATATATASPAHCGGARPGCVFHPHKGHGCYHHEDHHYCDYRVHIFLHLTSPWWLRFSRAVGGNLF
jgi:hypothetical protein